MVLALLQQTPDAVSGLAQLDAIVKHKTKHVKRLRAVCASACSRDSVGSGLPDAMFTCRVHVSNRIIQPGCGMLLWLKFQHGLPDLGRDGTCGEDPSPADCVLEQCACSYPLHHCTGWISWHGLQGAGEHCVLAAFAEEPGKYTLVLCNAIGMPLSTKQIPLEPVLLAMTPEHLVAASPDTVFLWRYDAEGASSSELPCGWPTNSEGGG